MNWTVDNPHKELNEVLGPDPLANKEKCDVCNRWFDKDELLLDKSEGIENVICRSCWIKEKK